MKKTKEYIKLGVFVITGLLVLVLLLYLIGKNRNLFDKTILIKTRFDHVHGLMVGNNVRFAGIDVGTIKNIVIINDSSIDVEMIIKKEMDQIIKKNAIVTIGTEGFVGYKLINIENTNEKSPYLQNGDVLVAKGSTGTDEIIETLGKAITETALASVQLKEIFYKVNHSDALWSLANDGAIRLKLHSALNQLILISKNLNTASADIANITEYARDSSTILNTLLYDTTLVDQLSNTLYSIENIGKTVELFEGKLSESVERLTSSIQNGEGAIPALINDTMIPIKINKSLDHLLLASKNLNQNMEALKQNFFFRGYFKKLDKARRDSLKRQQMSK